MSKRRSSLWDRFPPRSQRHDGKGESRHHSCGEHGTDLMQHIMRITAVLGRRRDGGHRSRSPASQGGEVSVPITREALQRLIAMSHFDEIDILLLRSEV
jgi:acetaldehyde dehydrogenase (acetylating)